MLKNKILSAMGGSEPSDPYFKYTTLLLHGDGTNGARNNTFIDSSPNNFTITRNGNVTQGSFSPFSKEPGKWGVSFDGSGDYLSVPNNTAFNFGTGDFTVEMFANLSNNTSDYSLFSGKDSGSFDLRRLSDGTIRVGRYQQAWDATSSVVSFSGWCHVAVTRQGTTLKIFFNGSQVYSGPNGTSYSAINGVTVGASGGGNYGPQVYLSGTLSNLRVIKGTALYTANFTPPTAPLTAVSGTSLLCCQDNRFKDNSANNFTLTPNGNVAVTPFSPFANSAEYSASVNGGSGFFIRGSSNNPLKLPTTPSLILDGDFTIDFWAYNTASSGYYADGTPLGSNYSKVNHQFGIYFNSNQITLYDGSSHKISSVVPYSLLRGWHHYAFVRSGATLTFYVNGVQYGSASTSVSLDFSDGAVGALGNYGGGINGYISNLRVIKGTALYTTNFTPPTGPLTPITNTSLLLNFTNAGIYDNTGMNNLETVGNAQVSTAVKKYGTGSLDFTGSGDHLLVPSSVFKFGTTTDFTVEFWLYTTTNNRTFDQFVGQWDTPNTFQFSNIVQQVAVQDPSGTVTFGVSMSSIPINTWVHIAYSRAGTSLKLFINGVGYTASRNADISPDLNYPVGIGKVYPQNNYDMNGYIDDLRITKGVARYTANFTPPTRAFPNK